MFLLLLFCLSLFVCLCAVSVWCSYVVDVACLISFALLFSSFVLLRLAVMCVVVLLSLCCLPLFAHRVLLLVMRWCLFSLFLLTVLCVCWVALFFEVRLVAFVLFVCFCFKCL